jgi:hypothetical protein
MTPRFIQLIYGNSSLNWLRRKGRGRDGEVVEPAGRLSMVVSSLDRSIQVAGYGSLSSWQTND